MDLPSAKDAARSKHRSTARHTPRGPGQGRGFGGAGGRGCTPRSQPELEANAWRYDEEASEEAAPLEGPPKPRSRGADLAALLDAAAQNLALGGGRGAAFDAGWGDAGDGFGVRLEAFAAAAAPSVGALLAWEASDLLEALAPLELHELLGVPRRHTEECESAFAAEVAAALAARGARRAEAPGRVPATVPVLARPAAVAAVPPDTSLAAADDDDAFLDEMLG